MKDILETKDKIVKKRCMEIYKEEKKKKDLKGIYLLYCHLLPPLQGQHASCQEMNYSKRDSKLRKEEKLKFYPLCPLSCRLGLKWTSTHQRLHIAVATHNCGISSR